MNAIYVECHLCHAGVGEACRWGVEKGQYHSRRIQAATGNIVGVSGGGTSKVQIEHGRAHGTLCTEGEFGTCRVCGQLIEILERIEDLIADEGGNKGSKPAAHQ